MCGVPARLRPLNAACHTVVGPTFATSGTSATPNGSAPVRHVVTNGNRSTVKRPPSAASYFAGLFTLQSTFGGALVDPAVPSVTGAVVRQTWMTAVCGCSDPDWVSVVTGSVIVAVVIVPPRGTCDRSGTTYVRALSRPPATPTCRVSFGYGDPFACSGQPSGVVQVETGSVEYHASMTF